MNRPSLDGDEALRAEFRRVLRRYFAGQIGRSDLYMFIAGFDWDDGSPEALALRPPIGRLELLIEEVAEQMRDDSEVREAARRILAEA